jgi:hypothetical protein
MPSRQLSPNELQEIRTDCGRLCTARRQERTLIFHGGQLTQWEQMGHCPDSRRDFSPTAPVTPGRTQLQSRRVADDR